MGFAFTGSWVHDLDNYLTTDPREEKESICSCEECGADIYEGETYYEIDDKCYCEDCVNGFKKIAEQPEEWFDED